MSSIKEVAERLNLTKSTVSHALNERPGKMSEQTRQRILETARAMGYVPSPAARAINNSRTGNIGLISRQFNNALYAALLLEIAIAVDARGGNLVTCITGRTGEHHGQDNLLHSRMVDGILTFPRTHAGLDTPDSPWMQRPIVFLLPDTQEDFASTVRFDDADGMTQVACYLWESGHRRPLFLQGLGPKNEQSYIGQHRFACFQQSWKAQGGGNVGQQIDRAEGQATSAGGYDAIQSALASADSGGARFDAVVAYNDQMAIGALSALSQCGIRVPDDVSLISWNDLNEVCQYSIPPLTSVHASPRDLAEAALDVLYRQIERGEAMNPALPREHAAIPVRLILRESSRAR